MSDNWKERILDGPQGFWSAIGLFMILGLILPVGALRDHNLGDVKLAFMLSSISFALGALRLFLKATDRYCGSTANADIWRIVGFLAIAGIPTLGAAFYVFADLDKPTVGGAAAGTMIVAALQIAVVFSVGLIVPDKKLFPPPG